MKKSIISVILILCVLISVLLCACDGSTEATAADGALTAVVDGEGNVTGYERRFHNSFGGITRLDIYDRDQAYLSFVLYNYDDNHRLYTETYYLANGIAQSRTVYDYYDDGSLFEKAYELPNGEATVECYDRNGNLYEKQYYDRNEQLTHREVLEDGVWNTYYPEEDATE